jgi:hypothetical protein
MAASPPATPGRIFISYRREEAAYPAGWLYDRLTDRLGDGQVFKDVDAIELGEDFAQVITNAVGSCDVLLALIGDRWLTITDKQGRRRLDNRDDFVRLEIEAALARKVLVIPILVDGASMPPADELPTSLVKLVGRQALELSPSRFAFDTSLLLKVLEKTLAEVQAGPARRAPDPSTTEPPKAPEWGEEVRWTPPPGKPSDERRRLTTWSKWRRLDPARRTLTVVLVLAVAAGLALAGRTFVYSHYWVGFDGDQVAVFRGVPGGVAGLHLSSLVWRSTVTREQVPPAYVLSLENGVTASSEIEARRIAACAPVVYSQPDCTGATAATTAPRHTTTTKAKG